VEDILALAEAEKRCSPGRLLRHWYTNS